MHLCNSIPSEMLAFELNTDDTLEGQVKSSHYYLYSAFNNANFVKAALHQLDIKLGGFISALQYFDG